VARAYLSLGSNIGDPLDNVLTAIGMIVETDGIHPAGIGSFYETQPQENPDQEWFVNTAIGVETELTAEELFRRLKEIEREMGREEGERYAPRLIDIDLIFYDDRIIETPDLTVPHPKAARRRFVLAPLCDIDAAISHPLERKTVGRLLEELPPDGQAMRKAGP
jgi:2-amino-4-hydroxy-6-hydroxymethyldihydropteridine diphosphokinase